MKEYLLDLKNELGTVPEAESFAFRFKEYKFDTINRQRVIVGIGKDDRDVWDCFKNYQLLFSIFTIIKDGKLPRYFNSKYLRSVMDDFVILKWCQEYGLPYAASVKESSIPLSVTQLLVPGIYMAWFNIDSFRYELAVLYSLYLLWLALRDSDEKAVDQNMLLVGLKPSDFQSWETKILKVKEALGIKLGINPLTLLLHYDKEHDQFKLMLAAGSLLDLCYYQLASLVTLSPLETNKHIHRCNVCNCFFWGHGNARHCPLHNRKTEWSRKHRKKFKEERTS